MSSSDSIGAISSSSVRKYTGKSAGTNEGNAQSLYVDLVKLMEGGMAARTSRTKLEGDINVTSNLLTDADSRSRTAGGGAVEFIDRYDGKLYEQPVRVIHDYGYVNSVKVGDFLACAVGTVSSIVEVVAMPTRKRLRLHVVEGPRVGNTFEWKRDLLLPFWASGVTVPTSLKPKPMPSMAS